MKNEIVIFVKTIISPQIFKKPSLSDNFRAIFSSHDINFPISLTGWGKPYGSPIKKSNASAIKK